MCIHIVYNFHFNFIFPPPKSKFTARGGNEPAPELREHNSKAVISNHAVRSCQEGQTEIAGEKHAMQNNYGFEMER